MKSYTLLCLCVSLLPAQRLTITSGATEEQVFQRDETNRATITLSGTATNLNNRPVEIRAIGKNGPLLGLDWAAAGKIAANKWTAKIIVPTGGPYRIEVRTATSVEGVGNIMVGDLWVLVGQSNMEGVGDLVDVEMPNGLVHSLDQADKWLLAEEPLHQLPGAADRVHWRRNQQGQPEKIEGAKLAEFISNRKKGAGLGLPFANEMVRRTGIPIGLLPCAHGGTSMDQWNPGLKDQAGDSLYGATIRRIILAGGKVRGILWYQGESDANPKAAPEFQSKFEKLVAAFRADLGQQDLPFYYVQIGRHLSDSNVKEWNQVQEMQRLAESRIPRTGMVPAVDLSLDDGIHVGTQDLKRLGKRLANLACRDIFPQVGGCAAIQHGPRLIRAKLVDSAVRVSFNDVNGKLWSPGRISGFSIHDGTGKEVALIFREEIDPNSSNTVVLRLGGKLPEGATLRYGGGKNPYCNLRDEADMAVPVFGPVAIER